MCVSAWCNERERQTRRYEHSLTCTTTYVQPAYSNPPSCHFIVIHSAQHTFAFLVLCLECKGASTAPSMLPKRCCPSETAQGQTVPPALFAAAHTREHYSAPQRAPPGGQGSAVQPGLLQQSVAVGSPGPVGHTAQPGSAPPSLAPPHFSVAATSGEKRARSCWKEERREERWWELMDNKTCK